ncbi:hypothetical protein ACFL96_13460 [Thermoproteota archaeon]
MLGVEWNTTYEINELPLTDRASFNFSLAPNGSLYFFVVEQDDKSIFDFPDQIDFGNDTIKQLDINYTLPFFGDYDGNKTLMNGLFAVNNSLNNNTAFLNLTFEILHYPIMIENTTNESYMTMEDNGKKIIVTTFSAITFNQTHEIRIKAPQDAIVDVECGTYLICPDNVTGNNTDDVRFNVRILVPEGELPGNFTSFANVSIGQNSGQVEFSITIKGDDIYNVIMYDVWEESCYDTPESLAECYKRQAQYNAQVANALLGRIEEGNVSSFCEDNVVVNETIKYVEVGNIDPELLASWDDLRVDYNDLSAEYTLVSSKFKKCIDDKGSLEHEVADETQKLSEEFIVKRSDLERDTIAKEEEAKDKAKDRVSTILMIIFLLLVVVFLVGSYMKANWMIADFPYVVVGGIAVFVFLCWLAVKIFM